jgi:DNA polymerase-3 subunit epsilon
MKKENITYFDLETTGLDINTIGVVSIYAVNYKKKCTIDSLINPQIVIPEAASNVHGIYTEDVENKPVFANVMNPITKLFLQSDYVCGYNICKYDIPLLISLYKRNNGNLSLSDMKFIDLFYIIKNVLPDEVLKSLDRLSLECVHKYLTGLDLKAHNAKHDVIACVDILSALNRQGIAWQDHILTYQDLSGSTISDLNYTMKFGKHKGRTIIDLIRNESSYIKWMRNKGLIKLSPELLTLLTEKE